MPAVPSSLIDPNWDQFFALAPYDRIIGLARDEVAVDCWLKVASCSDDVVGFSPVHRGTQSLTRSMAVDARGIPLATIAAPANWHASSP